MNTDPSEISAENTTTLTNPIEVINENDGTHPILLTFPHAATKIPEADAELLKNEIITNLPDTNWLIDEAFQRAHEMGITSIRSNYSRYLIDVNQKIDLNPRASDIRRDGYVIPKETTRGHKVHRYKLPTEEQISERIEAIYQPYHQQIAKQLNRLKAKFGRVLLIDVHGTSRVVPNLANYPLPDIILLDNDGKTAFQAVTEKISRIIKNSDYSFCMNGYLKTGHTALSYADPENKIFTLQWEISDDLYLSSSSHRPKLDSLKLSHLEKVIEQTIQEASQQLDQAA